MNIKLKKGLGKNMAIFFNIIGILITIFCILLFTVPFISRSITNTKLNKEGVKSFGTILEVKGTNTYFNNRPQLLIKIKYNVNGKEIIGSFKYVPSYGDIASGALAIGNTVPILYDKNNPQKLTLMEITNPETIASYQDTIYKKKIDSGTLDPNLLYLYKEGIEGKALIIKAEPTGKIIDDYTEFSINLKLFLNDGSNININEIKKYISSKSVNLMAPGSQIKVKYDSHNHSKFIFDIPEI